jgi:transcriptional regulator with PAS, ATPase and Fis domain
MEEDMERVKSELYMLRNRHLSTEGIIANSLEMSKIIEIATRVAEIDVNVLLLGESGVGKSLIAKFIHNKSPRCNGPFIEVNCGAIPETLFESEFFGYEAGAFTGASRSGKIGLAELAEGGTLFLDEIGELSMPHQVKLLKFIQEKQFFRIGGTKPRTVDFRLIAATNQDLEHLVKNKKFREDLYFRLNVVPVTIPPLRKRKEDILPMIDHFLHQFEKKYDRQRKLHEAVIHDLLQYDWKGNTRELINLMEHLVVLSPSTLVTREHLPQHIKSSYTPLPDFDDKTRTLPEILADVEKQYLTAAKKRYKTTTEIARASGISQPSVVRKLKRYKIE